ncbi:MAG TPA: DNA polymerase III subunit beta [Candidatus Paceibacterota bacterium]|nr:DNA polymerase III subunit beta [Candidatus Paceibacterota bacterium]
MKAECIKDKLKEAVFQVGKISAKNLSLPILESILIEAKGSEIILKATNLDIGLEVKVPAKVEKAGSVAVPGYILAGFIQMLESDNVVKLEAINNNLSVSTKKNSTLIKSFPADEFPLIPRVEKEESLTVEASKIVSGIRAVSFAALGSDIKPEISSVYIYVDNGSLYFVSTDSSRLAEKKFDVKADSDFSSSIIPIKNATELVRIMENVTGNVLLEFNKNQMSVSAPNFYFTSRVVGGIFPDYRQIIPKDKKTEVVVLKQELVDSIKLSSIFSDKFNQVTFKIIPSDSFFEISSRNQDKGESVTKIEATLEGEDIDMSFNSRFILDCLNSIKEDSVSIAFNGHQRPVIIKGIGDESFTYLLMPMIK